MVETRTNFSAMTEQCSPENIALLRDAVQVLSEQRVVTGRSWCERVDDFGAFIEDYSAPLKAVCCAFGGQVKNPSTSLESEIKGLLDRAPLEVISYIVTALGSVQLEEFGCKLMQRDFAMSEFYLNSKAQVEKQSLSMEQDSCLILQLFYRVHQF